MIFAPFAFQNQVVSTSVLPTSSVPTLNPTVYGGTFLYLNASASNSYPGTGTNWNSIAPTGSSVTASLVNGVVYESGSIKSFNFDGSNDYASIPYYAAASPTTGITILAWVNLDTYDGNRTILSKSNTVGVSAPYLQYSLKMDGAASPFDRPQFNVNISNTERTVNGSDITVPLNTWVLLAGTYDGGTLKIYKNGVQSTTITGISGSISAFTTDIQIGRWYGNGTQLWDGKMSLIMGVNRALTTAEILNIYNETVDYYYPPSTPILDDYPTAQVAYSLRKLDSSYGGNAIKVRRSSDNAEQDIGFTATGDLDTGSLLTFVGANSAFVTTMYDQSGNSVTASNANAAGQPRIVNTGTLDAINGKATMNFDGGDWFSGTLPSTTNNYSSVFLVEKVANINSNRVPFSQNNITSAGFGVIDHADGWFGDFNWAAGQEARYTPNNTNLKVGTAIHQSGSAPQNAVYINGTIGATTTTVTAATIGTNVNIGTIFNGTFTYLGNISEIVVWRDNQTSNVTGITNNMKSYYRI